MPEPVILLSVPGLRECDLRLMPRLSKLCARGDLTSLSPTAPAVTCPVQVNLTTGVSPSEHGVVANGFFWRDRNEVEMWTAWNSVVERPQIWDLLHEKDPGLRSAVWFPLLAKGCGADFICTPAPIHNPDGSESLWCYTQPEAMYGSLHRSLGHFPLQHFWGPMASIEGTKWIVSSALQLVQEQRPDFFYLYLPHLDYAAQKLGPDSVEAEQACQALDEQIGRLCEGVAQAWRDAAHLWLVASEYAITPVSHAAYPNRMLRELGLLVTKSDGEGREIIDFAESAAWALCDHQLAHLYVKDRDPTVIARAADSMRSTAGVASVWDAEVQQKQGLWHERSGDLVLFSEPESWFAYYYWLDDARAPAFARKVDIHRKPGYDPVELFWDTGLAKQHGGGVPLDAALVRGSHGSPHSQQASATGDGKCGLLLASQKGVLTERSFRDVDVCRLVLEHFGT